ncbi:molecular chaperone DnaJ [Mycoplasmopsis agassizii]|uniref:Chaperone protein DnaJ n=1 Tax=Mycoplasmopsis agassizii TaxID=33922 RepID=A0A269TIF4_9BACT|nr:molecular chaperone DnaJ [Mycoplasmopsis agassizii]PAK21177.1 molecular chaperone DnaJ [Mycoplasmopsis agassizii]
MSKKNDYYEILGVSRDADDKTIKTAYRKLAKEYHPDVNKSADAEQKMKDINEAYEVLSDSSKRAAYDKYGHDGANNPFGSGFQAGGFEDFGGSMSDIFESFFGGRSPFGGRESGYSRAGYGPRKSKGESYRIRLSISFLDAVLGTEIEQTIDHYENCNVCSGKGYEKPEDVRTCSTCKGKGYENHQTKTMFGTFQQQSICHTCGGEGHEILKKCSKCHGKQTIKTKKNIKIKIPAGITSGQDLVVTGYGGPGFNGGDNGDLYLTVYVEEHKYYRRVNNDIYINLPVSIRDIILENTISVPTPHGNEKIKMKSSYTNDLVVSIKGKGVRTQRGNGDLKIVLKFTVASYDKKTTKKLKDILESAKDDINEEFMKNFD